MAPQPQWVRVRVDRGTLTVDGYTVDPTGGETVMYVENLLDPAVKKTQRYSLWADGRTPYTHEHPTAHNLKFPNGLSDVELVRRVLNRQ